MQIRTLVHFGVFSVLVFALIGCNRSAEDSATGEVTKEMEQAALEAEKADEASGGQKPAKKSRRPSSNSADLAYVVQMGTFKVSENADRLEKKLKAAGLPAFSKKIERPGGVMLYSVRIEPTANRHEAERLQAAALAAVGEKGVILSLTK